MQKEDEVTLQPINSEIIKNILIEKTGKMSKKPVTRQISVVNGKIKQNQGSGGGCMGGPAGREYGDISHMTLQKNKSDDWVPEAKHKSSRVRIEFNNRTPIFAYFDDLHQAEKFMALLAPHESIDEKQTEAVKDSQIRGTYKSGYTIQGDGLVIKQINQSQGNKWKPSVINWIDTNLNFDRSSIKNSIIKKPNHQYAYDIKRQETTGQFIDREFPHSQKSLANVPREMGNIDRIEWKRAEEIFKGKKVEVFEGKIEPNDIKQGALGDCYFLSSLSSLAERDILIKKLFETQTYQDNGMYCVWLCIDGVFQQIVLDDYFPCINGQPHFSRANGPELWVLLMEKAYAKAYGCYQKIEAGLTGQAIRDLTGAPHDFVQTKEGVDKVWDFINYHDDASQGHIMTAGSQAGATRKETDMGQGIVTGHAYAILNHKVVNAGRGPERIIQLRNPWGSKEWTGRWSDKDPVWTPELKRICEVKDNEMKDGQLVDDGVFWIEVNDFCSQFSEVTTNMLNENYIYTSQRLNMQYQQKKIVKFYVKQPTKGYISVSQKDQRHYEGEGKDYQYSYVSLIVCKSDFSEYIGDEYKCTRDFYVNGEFTPGEYYAYVDVQWSPNKFDATNLTISAYTAGQVQFSEETLDDTDELLNQMLSLKPVEVPKKIKKYDSDPNISRVYQTAGGFLYFRYINSSNESTLKENVNMKSHQHLNICAPESNGDRWNVSIAPNSVKIVKYKMDPAGFGGYSLSFGFSSSISLGQGALIQQLKQQPAKQRQVMGQKTQVNVHQLFNNDGLFLLYENRDSKTFKEQLELRLTNLKVEPNGINNIEILLKPGETKMVQCSIVNPNDGCAYACSMLSQFV